MFSNSVILSATTTAAGTTWQAFADQLCVCLDVSNTRSTPGATPAADAAVAIRARRVGSTNWVTIRAGDSCPFWGIQNANQIEIQREDQSTTQLPVSAVALV